MNATRAVLHTIFTMDDEPLLLIMSGSPAVAIRLKIVSDISVTWDSAKVLAPVENPGPDKKREPVNITK